MVLEMVTSLKIMESVRKGKGILMNGKKRCELKKFQEWYIDSCLKD